MATTGGSQQNNSINYIIILGASGGCLDLIDLIEEINKKKKTFKILGLLDDNIKKIRSNLSYKILGKFKKVKFLKNKKKIFFATAIGNEKNFFYKKKIIEDLKINKKKFPNLIHPRAIIRTSYPIGYGNIFHADVKISRNVKIKNMNLFLQNTIINHDTKIGSYNIFNTNTIVAGNVTINNSNYFGQRSNIKDKITINSLNLIGMGSIVLNNIYEKKRLIINKITKKINSIISIK
jgi:sugar O-acyltransferase (sialic acid O-acetyltransferase NeuD family)